MRLRSLIGLLAGLAACGALAVAGAGCGTSAALDPVAQAAQNTQLQGGSHMAMSASFSVPGAASTISMSGGGYFNYKAKEGSFTMTMSGLPAVAQFSGGSLNIDERIKGTTVYVGSDLFDGKLPGGARWAKIDISRFAGAAGLNLQQLAGGEANPAQLLDFLKASAGGVTLVGHDQVRGVPTTRYRGTLDLEKLVDQIPSADSSKLHEATSKLIQQTGLRFIPAEVWVDASKRVRRFDMSMSVAQGGQTVTVALRLELFDYGPTPSVEVPPASETYDLTQAALSGLGTGS
jgi:hypothetical protein